VWIRIRGSMPLTNGSGCRSGSCYFHHSSRRQQKIIFWKLFCLLLFEGTFTSFFKDKKLYRSHKTVGFDVFLTIFAWWYKDPDPYLWQMDPDPGGPKTYGSYGSGSALLLCIPSSFYNHCTRLFSELDPKHGCASVTLICSLSSWLVWLSVRCLNSSVW